MTDCICQHRYQDSEYVRPCRFNLWSAVIRQRFPGESGLSNMMGISREDYGRMCLAVRDRDRVAISRASCSATT